MKVIAHNRPTLGKEELQAVSSVMKTGWIISGKEVSRFEENMKAINRAKYAVSLNSGTAGIHTSLMALAVKDNDEVIIPSYTPSDLLNAVNYVRARAIPVDTENDSFLMDVNEIEKKITKNTKAIIAANIFGFSVDFDRLQKLGIKVINDCAQSLGSLYKDNPSGAYGDISVFSFYATKLITSAQGGMIITNNEAYYSFIKDIIDYNGRNNYKVRYNYPLTDIAAAIGHVQLSKLEYFTSKRKEIGKRYQEALKAKNLKFYPQESDKDANFYRFLLKFNDEVSRQKAQNLFEKNQIISIIPINEYELMHNALALNKNDFPNSQDLSITTLSVPLYPSLSDEEIERVVETLKKL